MIGLNFNNVTSLCSFIVIKYVIYIFTYKWRTVPYSQGAALAAEFGIPFIECSAKTGENIGEAFSLLLSEVEKESPIEPIESSAQPECVLS